MAYSKTDSEVTAPISRQELLAEVKAMIQDKKVVYVDFIKASLEDVGFYASGFEWLRDHGFMVWLSDQLHRRSYVLHLAPLPKKVVRCLWIFLVTWYYIYWKPENEALRTQITLNRAINRVGSNILPTFDKANKYFQIDE